MAKTSPLNSSFAIPVGVVAVALAVLLVPLPAESLSVMTARALSHVGIAVPGMIYVSDAALAFSAVMAIAFAVNKVSIVFAALLLAVTVAAARILEDAHYLHDVAAGAVLGILVPGLTAGVTCLWSRRRARSRGVIE